MFHENNEKDRMLYKQLLYTKFPNKASKNKEHKKILIECMDSKGYIINNTDLTDNEHEEVEYSEIRNLNPQELQEYKTSLDSAQNSSFIMGTSIQVSDNPKFSRLAVTQTYGISSDEMLSSKLNELFDSVLSLIDIPETNSIKTQAIKLYFDIKNSDPVKGETNRGYILLSLYNALLISGICVPKEKLVLFFNNAQSKFGQFNLSSLSTASKKMKMHFQEQLPAENEICLCNMTFDPQITLKIKSEIQRLKENGTFNENVQDIEIASLIHHITKTPLKDISKHCGISAETISKKYKTIKF
jgi:hypothetical protein